VNEERGGEWLGTQLERTEDGKTGQAQLLATITADVTTAQAVTARASRAAYSAAAHGVINATARLAIVEALDSLRTASEELRKAALHG
jgi:hypothetical protein